MSTMEIIRLLDAIMNLAVSAGINVRRYREMREASGGTLTDAQLDELAEEARQSVSDL